MYILCAMLNVGQLDAARDERTSARRAEKMRGTAGKHRGVPRVVGVMGM